MADMELPPFMNTFSGCTVDGLGDRLACYSSFGSG